MGKIQRSASEGVHRVRHRAVWWRTRKSPEPLVLRHIAPSEPHLTAMSGTLRLGSGLQQKTLRLRICVSVPAGQHLRGVQVVEERALVTLTPRAATRFERNRATSQQFPSALVRFVVTAHPLLPFCGPFADPVPTNRV